MSKTQLKGRLMRDNSLHFPWPQWVGVVKAKMDIQEEKKKTLEDRLLFPNIFIRQLSSKTLNKLSAVITAFQMIYCRSSLISVPTTCLSVPHVTYPLDTVSPHIARLF